MSASANFEEQARRLKSEVDKFNFVDLLWHLKRATAMERAILDADPIKVGSLVVFTKTIPVDGTNNYGWLGAKDHMAEGCVWKVHAVEVGDSGHARYGCLPNAWVYKPNKSLYYHDVSYLRLLDDSLPPAQPTLLPCPMCGSDAVIVHDSEYWPRCTANKTMAMCILSRDPRPGHDGFKHLKDAVAVWNRRCDL
jgi:hypothetical protein